MGDEIFRHPNSVVGDNKLILSPALGKRRYLPDPQPHTSAVGRVFHCIGQQVGKHLLQAVLIRYHGFMAHMVGIDLQLLMLLCCQRPEHIHNILDQLRQGHSLRYKINLPAFNFRHIQHFVDKV